MDVFIGATRALVLSPTDGVVRTAMVMPARMPTMPAYKVSSGTIMMSASMLGMSAQDVADIVAYLRQAE